jgi:hypothetical protein
MQRSLIFLFFKAYDVKEEQHKAKVVPVQVMKAYGGKAIDPRILNLYTRQRFMIIFMSRPLYPRR